MFEETDAYDMAYDKSVTVKYVDPNLGQHTTTTMQKSQVRGFKQQLQQAKHSAAAYRKAGGDLAALGPWHPGFQYPPVSGPAGAYGTLPTIGGTSIQAPAAGPLTLTQPGICTSGNMPVVGWLAPIISKMAQQRRWVMSLDSENQVEVGSTNPLILAYGTPGDVVAACALAVQGQSGKSYGQVLIPNPWAATISLPLTPAIATFGVRLRITNSVINFKFGAYTINLVSGASTVTPVVFATLTILARKLPIDTVILNISNSVGLATIIPQSDVGVQIVPASNPAIVQGSDVIYIESLTQRDLGGMTIQTAAGQLLTT